ncbi:MAG: hypothetical protein D6741_00560 [Planctomycetota bacterium]|nr:MAG: hypothetical protein D6741_00560 [Planctomycetota bacterium]
MREALDEGHLKPEDFSLRRLAETLVPCGAEWVRSLDPQEQGRVLLEAGDGIDATAFLNVTGAIVSAKILEAYRNEAFAASRLVATVPTQLDGERIPGAGRIAKTNLEVHPGMPYPHVGFGEDYVETPHTAKHGLIVPVTREAIFFDRTHVVLQRAAQVGEILGLQKEKRILDCIIGAVRCYKHNGTEYDTYYAAGDGGPWVNAVAGNELVDWTNVDRAERLFAEMVDPTTGDPIVIRPNTVLVPTALRHAARRVFAATHISFQASGSPTAVTAPNPLGDYRVFDSRLLVQRATAAGTPADEAAKWWFLGDFRRAFAYMENWPITVTRSLPGSEADFTQDIVVRFKASERGAPAVLDPRYVVRSTG